MTSNRFSVIARENTPDLPPPLPRYTKKKQSCPRKDKTLLHESKTTPNTGKKSDVTNKDLAKKNSSSSKTNSSKKVVKDRKCRQPRDVTVILGESMVTLHKK